LIPHEAIGYQRQRIQCRLRLAGRIDVHQEDRRCLVAESELLDLAVEIAPASGRGKTQTGLDDFGLYGQSAARLRTCGLTTGARISRSPECRKT
jgi:hypothetical protein